MAICDSCTEFLGDKKKYVPVVCWECGSIVDILIRKEGLIGTIFSIGCRECSDIMEEKETFLVKKS